MLHTIFELAHHDIGDGHLTQVQHVAVPRVQPVDQQGHQLLQQLCESLVHQVSQLAAIDKRGLLLVNAVNLVEKPVLPPVQLDALDALKRLVDERYALVGLLARLQLDFFLGALLDVAHRKLRRCNRDYEQTVPANVYEGVVAGDGEQKGHLEEVRDLPNEVPDTVCVAHDNGADLTFSVIFVRRIAHVKVLREEQSLQTRVRPMPHQVHVVARLLPNRDLQALTQWDQHCHKDHLVCGCSSRLRLVVLKPLDEVIE